MGAITTIQLLDGAVTPVLTDFDPQLSTPTLSKWLNTTFASNDAAIAQSTLAIGISPASTQRHTDRVTATFAFPEPDTSEGNLSNALAGDKGLPTARFNSDTIVPDTFSVQNRKDFAAFIRGFVNSDEWFEAVVNRKGSW